MSNQSIAVVGAGIVGANTILQLQQNFPNAKITLIDDKFSDETTSYGPAGIFRPSTHFGGIDEHIVGYAFKLTVNLICNIDSDYGT